jgi:hypothetical protein
MRRVAFSLIELIIVIILIGIISLLVIKIPSSFLKQLEIEDLRDFLYPNGILYFLDNKEIIVQGEKKGKISLSIDNPIVYIYDGQEFRAKDFSYLKNKKIIFKYEVKNGIGDSFILKNGNNYYVFKPFYIKKVSSFSKAKKEFLLTDFEPRVGSFY